MKAPFDASRKVLSILTYHWRTLSSLNALLFPKSIEDHKKHFLRPRLKIDGRTVYFTERGAQSLRFLRETLYALPAISRFHSESELSSHLLKQYEQWWNDAVSADAGEPLDKFLHALGRVLNGRRRKHRFYAGLGGVRMQDVDEIRIGRVALKLFTPVLKEQIQKTCTNKEAWARSVETFMDRNLVGDLCFEGEYEADAEKARQLFAEDCRAAINALRFALCLWVPDKIHVLRAPIRLRADARPESRSLLSVDSDTNEPTLHWESNTDTEGPLFNPENVGTMTNNYFWGDLCKILAATDKTELDDIIVWCVKWIGDGQDDDDLPSAFVKYWTCLEAAFTADSNSVSETLGRSIAVLLIFGGYSFFKPAQYDELFRNIKRLYAVRSDIVHRGRSEALSETDLRDVANYSAYVVVSLLALRSRGYKSRRAIQAQTERILKRLRSAIPSDAPQ